MPKDIYPRPEYPRPDFQRGTIEGVDWLNLNGPWQFRFDGDKQGETLGWHKAEGPDWREQIIVPFCWESLAAWGEAETAGNENYYATRAFRNPLEVNRANHSYVARYEVGWYRRRVIVPNTEVWRNKRIILKIGAADFFTDCWCEGVHLGRHEGGYTPFEFDLTDTLKKMNGHWEGVVVLRVEDPMNNQEQPVGKQWHWYTSTSGIWQTVYVEPRNTSHIDRFRVYTDIDQQNARFEIDCLKCEAGFEAQLYIMPPGGEVSVVKVPIQNNSGTVTVELREPYLWTPNTPDLYKLEIKLQHQGRVVDHIRSYFGMRKIDSGPAEDPKAPAVLRLNNVPRYLRGALHQSYYPDGVYTAGDVEVLKNDILWAKKFGFNFLRIHIKIDDPLLLYYADTLGIMLMCDMPNFGEGGDTPTGRRRFEEMMRAAIKRDFNHPSIVAWCVFNETWGFGGQAEFVKIFPEFKKKILLDQPTPPGAVSASDDAAAALNAEKRAQERTDNLNAHQWVQQTWEEAKRLDPTRLVEDMSVVHWEHLQFFAHGDTDINSWHFYIDDYYRAKEHIQRVVDSTFRGSTFNYVPGFEYKGQPLINSEYGGVGALDGNRDCSWSFKFLTNELRRHGQISAYIYTELHDVEWEYNGFLTYDRTPKDFGFDPRIINESDVLPVDFPPVSRHAPGSMVKVPVASSHYATMAKDKISLRWSLGGMDHWGRIHQDLEKGVVPIKFPHRRVTHAHTIELKMPRTTMHCTLNIDAVDCTGKRIACNQIQLFVDGGLPARREETERTVVLRNFPSDWTEARWNQGMSTREDARGLHFCWGGGSGFFDYIFPLEGLDLKKARRLRVLFEASSRRVDTPQTTNDKHPSALNVELNGVLINRQILVDHPHDARGALSYLSGGKRGRGAYGYLINTAIEGEVLAKVAQKVAENNLHLRCVVPEGELATGGLTLYDTEAGRYPIALLCIVEW